MFPEIEVLAQLAGFIANAILRESPPVKGGNVALSDETRKSVERWVYRIIVAILIFLVVVAVSIPLFYLLLRFDR
jgi:hypothetical protein